MKAQGQVRLRETLSFAQTVTIEGEPTLQNAKKQDAASMVGTGLEQ